MSRVLVVVPPWLGHINPAAGVAAVLHEDGHEIAWVGHKPLLREVGVPGRVFPTGALFVAPDRPSGMHGMAALQLLWNQALVPLALSMDRAVTHAMDTFAPHAMLVDQQAIGAGIRAGQRGIPWLTLASSPGELATRGDMHAPVRRWTAQVIRGLADKLDIGSIPADPLFSPQGTLMASCAVLMGDVPEGLCVHATGSLLAHRIAGGTGVRETAGDHHVLVSMGTVSEQASTRFLEATWLAAQEGSTSTHWTIVDPSGSLGKRHARNVTLARSVDQLALLREVDAVLCHGGHNTVTESLVHGRPLVIAPIRDDQPLIAQRVEAAGAGTRLRFAHAQPAHVAAAVQRVLNDASFRRSATSIGSHLLDGEARVKRLLRPWLASPHASLPSA